MIEFPHDRHQDVIALLNRSSSSQSVRAFSHASQFTDDRTPTYNNCSICHTQRSVPAAPTTGWPDGFQPKPETFKSVPSGHDSCFDCHWKAQQPIATNCVGCHKLAPTPSLGLTVPTRISLKFMHDGGGEKRKFTSRNARPATSTSPSQQLYVDLNPTFRSRRALNVTIAKGCGRMSQRNSRRSTRTRLSSVSTVIHQTSGTSIRRRATI